MDFHDFVLLFLPKTVSKSSNLHLPELFELIFKSEFLVLRFKIYKTDDFFWILFIFKEIHKFACFCLRNAHFGVIFWDLNGSASPTGVSRHISSVKSDPCHISTVKSSVQV